MDLLSKIRFSYPKKEKTKVVHSYNVIQHGHKAPSHSRTWNWNILNKHISKNKHSEPYERFSKDSKDYYTYEYVNSNSNSFSDHLSNQYYYYQPNHHRYNSNNSDSSNNYNYYFHHDYNSHKPAQSSSNSKQSSRNSYNKYNTFKDHYYKNDVYKNYYNDNIYDYENSYDFLRNYYNDNLNELYNGLGNLSSSSSFNKAHTHNHKNSIRFSRTLSYKKNIMKHIKPLFDKNSVKNYVYYNQIVEHFK